MIYIYVLKCPITGEVKYVGKTNDLKGRISGHRWEAKNIKNDKCNWLRKLLAEGFFPIVKVEAILRDFDPWKKVERERIAHYKALGCRLFNVTEGGDGGGVGTTKWTDKQRKVLSQRQKKVYADPAKRAEISKRMKKLWRDPEYAKSQIKVIKKACNEPSYLVELRQRQKKIYANPDRRATVSEKMKKLWADPEYARLHSAAIKKACNSPTYLAELSKRQKQFYSDPARRAVIFGKG